MRKKNLYGKFQKNAQKNLYGKFQKMRKKSLHAGSKLKIQKLYWFHFFTLMSLGGTLKFKVVAGSS